MLLIENIDSGAKQPSINCRPQVTLILIRLLMDDM
jgi:hypothetical protein